MRAPDDAVTGINRADSASVNQIPQRRTLRREKRLLPRQLAPSSRRCDRDIGARVPADIYCEYESRMCPVSAVYRAPGDRGSGVCLSTAARSCVRGAARATVDKPWFIRGLHTSPIGC